MRTTAWLLLAIVPLVGGCGSEDDGGQDEPTVPPLRVKASDLERALSQGPGPMRDVHCTNGSRSGLGNPWRCTARRDASTLRFTLTMDEQGSYKSGNVESTPPPPPDVPPESRTSSDGKVTYLGEFNHGEALGGFGVPVAPR